MAKEPTDNNKSDLVEIGAFWKKTNANGTFLSGKVKIEDKEYTAFIFPNKKGNDNHPDYRISVSKYEGNTPVERKEKADKPAANNPVPDDDDIPF